MDIYFKILLGHEKGVFDKIGFSQIVFYVEENNRKGKKRKLNPFIIQYTEGYSTWMKVEGLKSACNLYILREIHQWIAKMFYAL